MSDQTISLDPDQAAASANLLAQQYETTGDVRDALASHGTNTGPTQSFKATLDTYVQLIQTEMESIQKALLEAQAALTQTVNGLVNQDASVSGDVATFNAGVETIPAPETTTSVPQVASVAASKNVVS